MVRKKPDIWGELYWLSPQFIALVTTLLLSFVLAYLLLPYLGSGLGPRLAFGDLILLALTFALAIGVSALYLSLAVTFRRHIVPLAVLGLAFSGLCLVSIFFTHLLNTAKAAPESLSYASTMLTWIGILVTLVTIITGSVGYVISVKVSRIDVSQERIQRNVVATAEIALRALPAFEESQQVPIRCLEPLGEICAIIFDESDTSIVEYLDRIGNGIRLRLAKAILLYGKGDYSPAKDLLIHALTASRKDYKQIKLVKYRLGIIYRQLREYEKSQVAFCDLALEACKHSDEAFLHNACVGLGVTLLAMYYAGSQPQTTNLSPHIKQVLSKIKRQAGERNPFLEHAFCLLQYVYDMNPNHVMASMYLAKICHEGELKQNLTIAPPSIGVEAANRTLHYLTRMAVREDLNIEANYESSRALCCFFLDPNHQELHTHLQEALRLGKALKCTHPEVDIYSEFQERQVTPDEWVGEVHSFMQRLSGQSQRSPQPAGVITP